MLRPCAAAGLLQNFGEFGPVKRIHIVPTKTIAFVKYHWRVSAEFAREAMDQQQLTGSTLNEVGGGSRQLRSLLPAPRSSAPCQHQGHNCCVYALLP